MQEKAFDLVAEYLRDGLSASEIREKAISFLDRETLETLWSIPRKNINDFVDNCLSSLALKNPFLDLGCGKRSLKPKLFRRYGKVVSFLGIDHYLHTEEINDSQYLPDIIAQAENLPIQDSSIGTVFCLELLEHVPDEQRILDEISRVTHPDGYLLLSLPGINVPRHEKLPFQRDYRRISPEEIKNLLRVHGFRNIGVDVKTLRDLQINIFVTARK